MSNARPRIPEKIKKMKRSTLEYYIEEANLGKENTSIAKMYLIDKIPQIDIAIELDLTLKTVSYRCQKIINKILEFVDNDIKCVDTSKSISFPKNTYKNTINL